MSSANSAGLVAIIVAGAVIITSVAILARNQRATPAEKLPADKQSLDEVTATSAAIGEYASTARGAVNLSQLNLPGTEVKLVRSTGQFNMPMWLVKLDGTNMGAVEMYRLPPSLVGKSTDLA